MNHPSFIFSKAREHNALFGISNGGRDGALLASVASAEKWDSGGAPSLPYFVSELWNCSRYKFW